MNDTDRPQRLCDVCGGTSDDHPRHVQSVKGVAPLVRHMDCCASQGCVVCTATEQATGGVRGHKLLAAIQAGALDEVDV